MGSLTGGKGKVSAAPMIEYGNKALALQKKQFDYAKDVSQPYIGVGQAGVNRLATLMGFTPEKDTSEISSAAFYDAYPELSVLKTKEEKDARNQKYKAWEAGQIAQRDADYEVQVAAAKADPLYGKLMETYTGQDIYDDPSYDFRLSQGQKALERQLSASGKYLTPAASTALTEYGQNMAAQEYQNAYNRFNADQTNIYNRLAGLAGIGQQQTGTVIGAGQNYANSATDLYTGMGNAITSAQIANQQNKGSMFNTLLNVGATLGGAYLTGGLSAGAAGAGAGAAGAGAGTWMNSKGLTYFI